MQFIVLSSSRGTTFQAVIDAMKQGTVKAHCVGLITDSSERGCIAKAHEAGLPFRIVDAKPKPDREAFDHAVDAAIRDLIAESGSNDPLTVLAEMGWMWIHTPWFIRNWKNRIINVHPALLPKHGGKGMYGDHVHKAVLTNGEQESGMTIHIMDENVDTGPILVQKKCSVETNDTVDALKDRIQKLEMEWYPKALQMIHSHEIVLP